MAKCKRPNRHFATGRLTAIREGTACLCTKLMRVQTARAKIELTLWGDPESPRFREAAAILDQSGFSYREEHVASAAPRIAWGKDALDDFSRPQLVHFLWEHGAHFEDS